MSVTPESVKKLCEKMGNRNHLAAKLEVSENTIKRWEVDISKILPANRRELERLMKQYGIAE